MPHRPADIRAGRLDVTRHARWTEIGDAAPEHERWFVLHGYGQRGDRFLRRFRSIAGPDRLVVAPEGLSRFYLDDGYQRVGASWMTRDDRELEIRDTLAWLDALASHLDTRDGRPSKTTVLGFSQGAHTAGRWAARGESHVDQLVCWGAGLPQDVPMERFATRDLAIDFVVGRRDVIVPPSAVERELDAVRAAGLAFRLLDFDGGHEIDTATLDRIAAG